MSYSQPIAGDGVSKRLFLGIETPALIQASLAALQTQMPGARWQCPENFHLTLRFLGSVPEDQQTSIHEAMGGLDVSPFEIRVHGVGSFAGKVLWAAIEPNEDLEKLKQRVDDRLVRLGIPLEESDFVPHITLARTHKSASSAVDAFLAEHSTLELTSWAVQGFTLFKSEPGDCGPIYRVVERYALVKGLV